LDDISLIKEAQKAFAEDELVDFREADKRLLQT